MFPFNSSPLLSCSECIHVFYGEDMYVQHIFFKTTFTIFLIFRKIFPTFAAIFRNRIHRQFCTHGKIRLNSVRSWPIYVALLFVFQSELQLQGAQLPMLVTDTVNTTQPVQPVVNTPWEGGIAFTSAAYSKVWTTSESGKAESFWRKKRKGYLRKNTVKCIHFKWTNEYSCLTLSSSFM